MQSVSTGHERTVPSCNITVPSRTRRALAPPPAMARTDGARLLSGKRAAGRRIRAIGKAFSETGTPASFALDSGRSEREHQRHFRTAELDTTVERGRRPRQPAISP